jgi:arginine repressor
MPRPRKDIPLEDVKILGLRTLVKRNWTQEKIEEYYKSKGIDVNRVTISRRLKEIQ